MVVSSPSLQSTNNRRDKRCHGNNSNKKKIAKRFRSSFGECPLCHLSLPWHKLEIHAAGCSGSLTFKEKVQIQFQHNSSSKKNQPIPGLYLYEDFITKEEEEAIILEIDGKTNKDTFLPWKDSKFNGHHFGKRWGVHCNLRDRMVSEAEHPLPQFMKELLLPKLRCIPSMAGCIPNEANAIDYRRNEGHYLKAHVDDRQLSKEPIANLSLVGDCFMTFRNQTPQRNTAASVIRVWLPRRCLQVVTGKARYDFSHAIENSDLLSPRRVSVTMRESPLTVRILERLKKTKPHPNTNITNKKVSEWWHSKDSSLQVRLQPTEEPLPGLLLFENFITEEEEQTFLKELDQSEDQKWVTERHSGVHCEKRFGVDHDLWDSTCTRKPKHALPDFVANNLRPRLAKEVEAMQRIMVNEVNSISYQKDQGHSLASHVDDRQKYKEPIANLSLAGDCIFTYQNVSPERNLLLKERRVLVRRRCLQVITSKARYEFAHGIKNEDLLSKRRVSVTMRCTK